MKTLKSPLPQRLFPFHSLRMQIVSCLLWVIPKNQNHCLKRHNFILQLGRNDLNLSAPAQVHCVCWPSLGLAGAAAPHVPLGEFLAHPNWKNALEQVSQYLEP